MHEDHKTYDPDGIESEIKEYWEANEIYDRVKESKRGGEDFYFCDGPPYTSGAVHIGTAYNKIIKDFLLRHLRMKGYNVRDQPGYDMHGLPIEVRVERALGIKNKKEIELFGVENFVKKCREYALDYEKKMTDEFRALGVWMDWENPYETINNTYVGRAWWLLKRADEQNLLERSLRIVNWCPRCETALADAELEYGDKDDPSIYVKMPLRDGRFVIIWTTTPWTIPANEATAFNPDFAYDEVEVEKNGKGEVWILLNADEILKGTEYTIKKKLGKLGRDELENREYVHPLETLVPYHRTGVKRLLPAGYVTAEHSGFVHTAPGHGEDDFNLGKEFNLETFCPVDGSGTFTDEAGKYGGKTISGSNREIIEDLKVFGYLVKEEKIIHRYGFCPRCKTPIIYRATEQWFLRIEKIKDRMIEEIKRVNWYPEWAGSARELEWVKGARNWCISRQRYWGIPLPIWGCDCGEIRVIGGRDELRELSGYEGEELHRPWIDGVKIRCDRCGSEMRRVPDVQDVWLDSGVCSWAALDRDESERFFPPKLITEAHDQTRGWFYSQLGAGIIGFNRAPYDEVLMHGWVLSESGDKMSKSVGNVVIPAEASADHGVDALRFYLLSISAPWDDKDFSFKGLKTSSRLLNTLWNSYIFSTGYMVLDGFDPEEKNFKLEREDMWMLSRLESTKRAIEEHLKGYELHKICRELDRFLSEDLSRFYIRLIRDRVWTDEKTPSKNGAYKVLYTVLLELSKLFAPITPHISEKVYRNLSGRMESVHMEDWPEVDEAGIDVELEKGVDMIRKLIEGVLRARQSANLKLRWPLKGIIIESGDGRIRKIVEELGEMLLSQTNSKSVDVVDKWDGKTLKISGKRSELGKIFKNRANEIFDLIGNSDPAVLSEELKKGCAELGGFEIRKDMVEFREVLPVGFHETDFDGGKVYIDARITEEVRAEGIAREIVRRVQEMRKEMGLKMEDHILCSICVPEDLVKTVSEMREHISKETRAKRIEISGDVGGFVREWNINGIFVKIGIFKA